MHREGDWGKREKRGKSELIVQKRIDCTKGAKSSKRGKRESMKQNTNPAPCCALAPCCRHRYRDSGEGFAPTSGRHKKVHSEARSMVHGLRTSEARSMVFCANRDYPWRAIARSTRCWARKRSASPRPSTRSGPRRPYIRLRGPQAFDEHLFFEGGVRI